MTTTRSEQLLIGIMLIFILLLAAWFIPQIKKSANKQVRQIKTAKFVRV